ncbi:MAG: hypothetical protein VSS75_025240 [Candidatus Parabeggiatoa sp.]|nr:hypothetical protein [Candidatus Parabeggiatoa sp.]
MNQLSQNSINFNRIKKFQSWHDEAQVSSTLAIAREKQFDYAHTG